MQSGRRTLIKVETDAGLVGYGPCGESGPFARAVLTKLEGSRLPHLGLVGKDPLAIRVHFHNMFYAYLQRGRQVRVLSGVDIALWDLAGKILNPPVSKLLGGNFREDILLYSHCPGGDFFSKEAWQDRAQKLREDPRGFKRYPPRAGCTHAAVHTEYWSARGAEDSYRLYTRS
ncbi:hypothetical protein CMK12_13195 [Candidatus Poribacteria bacterium]|nr:hypothetical protein [Candidatus Poribacteria bacterium]